MNPLTNVKNLQKMNKLELEMGYTGKKGSWHDQYSHSAWIFVGGLPYDLTEGDVITVFSQYGEIANINLVRDKKTGGSKGFAFLCYEDQRSTVLAVDNFNGTKICGRTLRVDHVADYKPPDVEKVEDDEARSILLSGCAPEVAVQRELQRQRSLDDSPRATSASVGHPSKSEFDPNRPGTDGAAAVKREEAGRTGSKHRTKKRSRSRERDGRRGSRSRSGSENGGRGKNDDRDREKARRREEKREKERRRARSADSDDAERREKRKKDKKRERSRSRSKSRDRDREKRKHKHKHRDGRR